jgi:hypothetical protein
VPNLRIMDVRRSAQAALATVTVRDRDGTPVQVTHITWPDGDHARRPEATPETVA